MRAILAAGKLDPTLDIGPAIRLLDRFVESQEPDGSWRAGYFLPPSCDASQDPTRSTANRADIGSIAACLSLATGQVDPVRRESYLSAARYYTEAQILPFQLATGAFPNGLTDSVVRTVPYSVATATQLTHLVALHRTTQDAAVFESIRKASAFLAESVHENGTVTFYPHDSEVSETFCMHQFGNLLYVLEGLLLASRVLTGPEGDQVRGALRRLFLGSAGLVSCMREPDWSASSDPWENSKRAGALYLVSLYCRWVEPNAELDALSGILAASLALPPHRTHLGVLAPPFAPFGEQAVVATGLAGLGFAAQVDPAVLFPD